MKKHNQPILIYDGWCLPIEKRGSYPYDTTGNRKSGYQPAKKARRTSLSSSS